MKRCVTAWPLWTKDRPERRRPVPLICLMAGLVLVTGCVTRGTHDQVVQQRDALALAKHQLEERVALLEASNESLHGERLRLIDRSEDLRQEHSALVTDVDKLKRSKAMLSETLQAREQELSSLAELTGTYEGLVADLESEVASGQIEIEQLREGLRLNLSDEILFASGSAELEEQGRQVLRKLARKLLEIEYRVEVQGHTDDLPIRRALTRRYPTNWELAGARAARVARELEAVGVNAQRLTAVSYADHRPVAPNDTPEGRSRNRRIEIRLLPPKNGEQKAGAAPSATDKTPTP